MEIIIKSDRKNLEDAEYAIATEKIVFGAGNKVGFYKKRGSFKDFQKGILGYHEHRIEVPAEGIIIYQDWQTNLGYLGIVKLEGFDEKNSQVFQDLKNSLETISSSEDIVQLEYDLFPEKFKGTSVEEVKKQMRG
ncbi:hypothetical protein KAT80_01705 [Candidatus Pacearchaeota archaeon]|nr:hypothetical protein [Candidatus Pacearchaeota archaeon]